MNTRENPTNRTDTCYICGEKITEEDKKNNIEDETEVKLVGFVSGVGGGKWVRYSEHIECPDDEEDDGPECGYCDGCNSGMGYCDNL